MQRIDETLQRLKIGKITKAEALPLLIKAKQQNATVPSSTLEPQPTPVLEESVQRYLLQKLQTLLQVDAEQFDTTENFMELGIDSTQLIALVQEVETEIGIELYPTLLFEYQTIASLAAHLAEEYRAPFAQFLQVDENSTVHHNGSAKDQPVEQSELLWIEPSSNQTVKPLPPATGTHVQITTAVEPERTSSSTESIAVIGMAGVFPQSPDVATFWHHLVQKTDLMSEIPADHFDYRPWYDPAFQVEDKLYCKWGSFIDDVDKFDAGFFNISPREAELMDPQLRYLLQVLYQTAEDAGYGSMIRGSHTGVYVGACFHDYRARIAEQTQKVQAHDGTGNAATMLANRPSFYLNLTGPSMAIDTACSSSLFALHHAYTALQNGECEMALAAGVNLILSSAHYRYFCTIGALSPTGRCHTFDERADGYVPGEAIAAVLLKPLQQAIHDGDQIYGIIKGSAVGHGGYTPSITAPSVDGEAKVLLAAWEDAGINPESLGYIEAHGTGTKLGDPIEIAALTKAFRQHTQQQGFCAIGSAKAHIGHTEGAAGITGVIKALLSLRHATIPAMPQFETTNPYIALETSPFTINREPTPWPPQHNRPRRVGVSSFGFGGAYAHLVLEEYAARPETGTPWVRSTTTQQPSTTNYQLPVATLANKASAQPHLIVLSAKNEERLQAYATSLLLFLEQQSQQKRAGDKPAEKRPNLQHMVQAMVAELLGVDPAEIDDTQAFATYGFDAVQLNHLQRLVETQYQCELPPTLVSLHASVAEIVHYLMSSQAQITQTHHAVADPRLSLPDIAYTLQTGREAMEARVALVASTIEELTERLRQYVQQPHADSASPIAGLYQSHTHTGTGPHGPAHLIGGRAGQAFIQVAISDNDLDRLAQLWVMGVAIDWQLIYPNGNPRRISLPTYPFAKERYWLADQAPLIGAVNGTSNPIVDDKDSGKSNDVVLHPLLHQNTSTLTEQRFSTTFTGNEFFLRDHQVEGNAVLPGVVTLEMARVAGELAVEEATVTELRNVVWLRPLAVDDTPQEVQLGLQVTEDEMVQFAVQTSDDQAGPVVHSQGTLVFGSATGQAQSIDLAAIQQRCSVTRSAGDCYQQFTQQGLTYGPTFQVITEIVSNETEVLAQLHLPEGVAVEPFHLHPSLLDGALQSVVGLFGATEQQSATRYLPMSLEKIELLAPLPPVVYAHVTCQAIQATTAHFDIVVTDTTGRICAKLHNFTAKATSQTRSPLENSWYYQPFWTRQESSEREQREFAGDIALVMPKELTGIGDALAQHHPQQRVIHLFLGSQNLQHNSTDWEINLADEAGVVSILAVLPPIDTLYFLGGLGAAMITPTTLHELDDQQEQGILNLFRLVKMFVQQRLMDKLTAIKVLTHQAQQLYPTDPIHPAGAALTGFTMSLAREYRAVDISVLDITLETTQAGHPILTVVNIPAIVTASGNQATSILIRHGVSYRQQLAQLILPADPSLLYRQNGVYLILGGAGGIGLETAVHLAQRVEASVVLVGRSVLTAEQEARLQRIRDAGGDYLYCQADGTDLGQMQAVLSEAKAHFGAIHGVIHSALVLDDSSIHTMHESSLRAVLAPKLTGSVVLAEAVKEEPLDFLLFFSSGQSFWGNMGQSNYAAASTFQDAYALYLNQNRPYPVKVINWGYWGSVGVVATDAYRQRLLQQGLQSIQVNDGMMAIDQILAAPLAQVAAIKVDQRVLHQNGLTVERQAKVVAPAYASLMARVVASLTANVAGLPLDQATLAQEGLGFKQLESFAGAALLQAYQQIPAFLHVDESHDRAALAQRLQILPKYQRFFDATLDILAANDYLIVQGATVATTEKVLLANGASRHQQETLAENHPLLQPHLTLLTTCLQRLPEILQGQISATDVLFPNGSLDLVSEIYQRTAITDHFNRLVACAVQSMIEERLRFLEPGEKIQIIEIGAGNEGTTSFVLETLAPYQTQIDYLYRDISQSFLRHDQHTFGDQYPFVQVGLLDIEKSPIAQDIELNQADIVLGTNVVHATRNIQQTLQNLKALLKANGLLILNEGTRFSAFTTLTFGLLDGWWVFEDKAQRIEHTPFLSTEQWRRALQSAGFTVALGPALSAMDAQAVLLAESDGVIQITGVDPEPLSISPTADLSNSTHIPEREQPKEQPSVVNPAVSTASNGELQRATEAYLQTIFAEMLKSEPERLQVGQTFETFGIDSIVGIEIVNRLRQDFSADISTTILFEYMTLEQLADYFLTHHTDEVTRLLTVTPTALPVSETSVIDPTSQQAIAPKRLFDNQTRFQQPKVAPTEQQREVVEQPAAVDIAVIGLSGRYPMAENLAQFWENLKVGRNCISEIPAERWDHNLYYHPDTGSFGKSQSKWGGFIDDVDTFDAHFFNIPPHEATLMDPQERLFLETVWATIEDAGYSRQALAERQQVGVFVGVMYQHYPFVANDPTMMAMLGSSSYWQIANRVSHWFDWEGPSLAIDTACSSSLTAIHLACESIKRGDCEMAVAGGVNLSLHPAKWFVLGQTEMLGSTDRSKSLGDGDGYVPGEGVGAVLLKRLDQAIADHDQIYAVIKGGAINHGGKTASFTVPNPNAQADLIQATLAKTGVDPQMISYVEVAANGSALGDPIELAGLSKAFQPASDQHHVVRQPNGQDVPATANQAQLHHEPLDQKQWCPIGSVKSNIGHLEAASGISQLTKVLLQLKHQTLVPSINADPVNPHLALEKTPFFIQREMQDWQQPELELDGKLTRVPRRAAVSSFGAGGSNAHLILEEYQTPAITQPVASTGPYLIVLSAKNEERLQAHATNLLTFLNQNTMVALADLAYTLQVGREAMAERLALIVRDHDELQQALALVLQTSNDHLPLPTSIFQGNTAVATQEATIFAAGSVGQELIQRSIAEGDWEKVALFWTKGVTIPWEQLYERARPQRISLPTYPFARQRYWLTEGESLFAAESNTPAFAIPSNGLDGAVPATITRSEPIVPPRTAAEKTLASIWSELLEIEEIGIHDNFFALGGHSLLATRLVSRINTTFHIAYPIHRLFEIQTIAGLANDIEAQQVDQQADAQLREELQGPRENGTAEFTSHAVDKQQTESKVVEGRL